MSFNEELLSHNYQTSKTGNDGINIGETERVVCAIAGGALAVYGFRNRTLGGLLITLQFLARL